MHVGRLFPATCLLAVCLALAPKHAPGADDIPDGYELVYSQDFADAKALADFEFSSPDHWKHVPVVGRGALEHDSGNYSPPHRSPKNIALLATHKIGSFVLDAEVQQTGREYGHRDACFFLNFQDPANYYYVHVASRSDDHAHQIFIVDDSPRNKISLSTTKGYDWGKANKWHRVRIIRDIESGKIEVYVGDLSKPLMTANDKTHGAGYVGFGSFDDSGRVSNIKVYAKNAIAQRADVFKGKSAAALGKVQRVIAAADPAAPLKIHMISGAREYQSEPSLKQFSKYLEANYHVSCAASWGHDGIAELPGLEALESADLLLVFARRMKLGQPQMSLIRAHCDQGKPVVGIRTAGHAFEQQDNQWFDRQVMGANYQGHFGDAAVKVENVPEAANHPVLAGVGPISSKKLYKAGPLAENSVVLQTGQTGQEIHPVTVVHQYRGGRTFFTSLGVPEDFANDNFRRMLINAIFWTSGRDAQAKAENS